MRILGEYAKRFRSWSLNEGAAAENVIHCLICDESKPTKYKMASSVLLYVKLFLEKCHDHSTGACMGADDAAHRGVSYLIQIAFPDVTAVFDVFHQ